MHPHAIYDIQANAVFGVQKIADFIRNCVAAGREATETKLKRLQNQKRSGGPKKARAKSARNMLISWANANDRPSLDLIECDDDLVQTLQTPWKKSDLLTRGEWSKRRNETATELLKDPKVSAHFKGLADAENSEHPPER